MIHRARVALPFGSSLYGGGCQGWESRGKGSAGGGLARLLTESPAIRLKQTGAAATSHEKIDINHIIKCKAKATQLTIVITEPTDASSLSELLYIFVPCK